MASQDTTAPFAAATSTAVKHQREDEDGEQSSEPKKLKLDVKAPEGQEADSASKHEAASTSTENKAGASGEEVAADAAPAGNTSENKENGTTIQNNGNAPAESSKPGDTQAKQETSASLQNTDQQQQQQQQPQQDDPDVKELQQDTLDRKQPTVAYKPDGTVDTSKMIPAPKPELKIEENVENPLPHHLKQYMLKLLKSIKRLKDAGPFLTPVDTVKLQIPFYYNFIPTPMDISTIEKKLNANAYHDQQDVHDDFNLMVNNCIKFNGDKAAISRMGLNIQASFEKLLLNAPPRNIAVASSSESDGRHKRKASTPTVAGNGVPKIRRDNSSGRPKREIHPPKPKDMPYDIRPRNKKLLIDLRFASQVVKELTSKKHESYSYPFLEPVDPVALDCPTYFDFVKEPMDLSTVQNKLQNNQYDALDEFYHDVKLIFKNCYIFNPEGTPVNQMGHKLEAVFEKKWQERPVHAPTPPPQSAGGKNENDEDDEDDEEEEEEFDEEEEIDIEQSIMNNQAIQFLELQIERMKKDLEKMKKEEYEKAKKRAMKQKKKKTTTQKKKAAGAAAAARRRKSTTAKTNNEQQIELTFDMKKELSEKIADLSEKKLQHVMKIINESVPDLQKDGEDEIELDMDMLDDETLLKLYNYVVSKNSINPVTLKKGKGRGGNGRNGNGSAKGAAGKAKGGPKKLNDRDKKIDILKQRLEEYDKGNSKLPASSSESSDDDDDDESESSEEE